MHRNPLSSYHSQPSRRPRDESTSPPIVHHPIDRPAPCPGDSSLPCDATALSSSTTPHILASAAAARSSPVQEHHSPAFSHHAPAAVFDSQRLPFNSHPHPHPHHPQQLYHGAAHAQSIARRDLPLQQCPQPMSSSGASTFPTTSASQSFNPIPARVPLHANHVPQDQHRRVPPANTHLQLRRCSDVDQRIPPAMDATHSHSHAQLQDPLPRHARPHLVTGLSYPIGDPATVGPTPASNSRDPPPLRKSHSDSHIRPEDAWTIRTDTSRRGRPQDPSYFDAPEEYGHGPPWIDGGGADGVCERDPYVYQHPPLPLLQDRRRKRARDEPHPTSRMGGNGHLTLEPVHIAHHNHAGSRRPEPPPGAWPRDILPRPGPTETRTLHVSRRQALQQEQMDQQQMQSFRLQRAGLIPSPTHVPHHQGPLQPGVPAHPRHPIPPPPHVSPVSPDTVHFMDALKIKSPTSAHGMLTSLTAQFAPQSTSPKSVSASHASLVAMDQQGSTGAVMSMFPQYLAISPGAASDSGATGSFGQRDKSASLPRSQTAVPRQHAAAGAGDRVVGPPTTRSHSSTAQPPRGQDLHTEDSELRLKRPRSTPDMGAAGRAEHQQHARESAGATGSGSRTLRSRSSMSNLPRPHGIAAARASGAIAGSSGAIATVATSDPAAANGGYTSAKPVRKSIRSLISGLQSTLEKFKVTETPASVSPPALSLSIARSTSVSPLVSPTLSIPSNGGLDASVANWSHAYSAAAESLGPRLVAGHVVQTRGTVGRRLLTSIVFSLPIPGIRPRAVSASAPTPPVRQRELVAGRQRLSADLTEGGLPSCGLASEAAQGVEEAQRVSHDVHAAAAVLAAETIARSEPRTSTIAGDSAMFPLVASTPFSALQQVAAVPPTVALPLDRSVFVPTDQQIAPARQPLSARNRVRKAPYQQQQQQQQQAQEPASADGHSVNNLLLATYADPLLTSVDMAADMQPLMTDPVLLDAFLGAPSIGTVTLPRDSTGLSPLLLNQSAQSSANVGSSALNSAGASDAVARLPTPQIPVLVSPDISAAWSRSPPSRIGLARDGPGAGQGRGSAFCVIEEGQPGVRESVLGLSDHAVAQVSGIAAATASGQPVQMISQGVVVASVQQQQQQQQLLALQHSPQQPQLVQHLVFQQQSQHQPFNSSAQIIIHPGLFSPISSNPSATIAQMDHYPTFPPGFAPVPMSDVPLQPTGRITDPLALPLPSPPGAFFASPISPNPPRWSAFHSLPQATQGQDASAGESASLLLFDNSAAGPSPEHSQANQGHSHHPSASGR